MPGIETIYPMVAGMETDPIETESFVGFIEGLVARGNGFPLYRRQPLEDEEGSPIDQKPIIAFSGRDSVARISDPDKIIPGSFMVSDKRLIYHPSGLPIETDRDSYRWRLTPYEYYTDGTCEDVLRAYENSGYPILVTNVSLFDYAWGRFGVLEPTTLDRIVSSNQ